MRLLALVATVLLLALLYRRHRRGSLIPILRWPFLVSDFLLALAAPGFNVALDNVALRQQLGVFKPTTTKIAVTCRWARIPPSREPSCIGRRRRRG